MSHLLILCRVAAAKAEQEKVAEQKANYYGTHDGISCDGCGAASPLVGYRYKCSKCPNHDVCEQCFDAWAGGTGVMTNELNQQKLSSDPKDHVFKVYKDKSFKGLVKSGGGPTLAAAKKTKPNDPCTCGSGKKFKKCCLEKS